MKKKELSPFERDTINRIEKDPKFEGVFFKEILVRPVRVQVVVLKKLFRISQRWLRGGHAALSLASSDEKGQPKLLL